MNHKQGGGGGEEGGGGGRVGGGAGQDHLVPLGEARLGRIGFDESFCRSCFSPFQCSKVARWAFEF